MGLPKEECGIRAGALEAWKNVLICPTAMEKWVKSKEWLSPTETLLLGKATVDQSAQLILSRVTLPFVCLVYVPAAKRGHINAVKSPLITANREFLFGRTPHFGGAEPIHDDLLLGDQDELRPLNLADMSISRPFSTPQGRQGEGAKADDAPLPLGDLFCLLVRYGGTLRPKSRLQVTSGLFLRPIFFIKPCRR